MANWNKQRGESWCLSWWWYIISMVVFVWISIIVEEEKRSLFKIVVVVYIFFWKGCRAEREQVDNSIFALSAIPHIIIIIFFVRSKMIRHTRRRLASSYTQNNATKDSVSNNFLYEPHTHRLKMDIVVNKHGRDMNFSYNESWIDPKMGLWTSTLCPLHIQDPLANHKINDKAVHIIIWVTSSVSTSGKIAGTRGSLSLEKQL